MKMIFNGRKTVITGGGGGIGYEICRSLFLQGVEAIAILGITYPNENVTKLRSEFPTKNILHIKTDVSNKIEIDNAFKQIKEEFQSIDIFIGNSGVVNDDNIEKCVNINFMGVVHSTLAAMQLMSKEHGGNGGIIGIVASVASLTPFWCIPIYTATKHAILGFIRCLSNEYYFNKHGIKNLVICPGVTDTPILIDIEKRVMFPETSEIFSNQLNALPHSSAEDMGKYITEVIDIGKNGSVWITDQGIKEINIPHYWP